MSKLEVILGLAGLIYVVLASLNKSSCWIFGIISSGVLAFVSFVDYKLYADVALNVFYVLMGFYGLWVWYSGDQEKEDKEISQASRSMLITIFLGGSIVTLITGYLLGQYSSAFATYWDAGTTVFSIIATWFLVQRYIENWYMWIVIDLIMTWLYYRSGGESTAALFLVYTLVAIYGAYQWNKTLKMSTEKL